ncbi:MAG TPA: ABC transporter permease [Thermoanaerobaculia bacterium]|nr:ABC transporter permease [Thermoanaerobaculia bacterium]
MGAIKREPMFRRYLRFWRADPRLDVHEELAFHLAMRTAEYQESGMDASDAERATRDRFGDVNGVRTEVERLALDRHSRQLRVQWWDALVLDLRLAVRTLRAKPAYAIALTLTLALGIGANLAIFTVVNSVLLRPLPLADPDRLVRVYDDLRGAGANDVGMSVPELEDLTTRAGVFDEVSATFPASTALEGGDRVERIELLATSPNYFELLQASAAQGRVYSRSEWKPGFLGSVVISDALWRRQFGATDDIVGKTIRLDEDPYTIIGVMPPDFRHPGTTLSGDVDVWGGAGFSADPFPSPPTRARILPGAIARLKRGVTLEQAQARLNAFGAALQREFPNDYPDQMRWSLRIEPVQSTLTGNVRPTLVILLAAVSFLLLIVCVNLASLMLARSSTRMRDYALRQALGASRGRIVRQLLTESLLVAVIGGLAAIIALKLSLGTLLALLPSDLPRLSEIHASWQVLAAALGLSIVTGVLIGLAPAYYATGADANRELKEGGRTGAGSSKRQNRSRSLLVVSQIALSVVLLIAAGLLIRSFAVVLRQNPGLDPTSVVTGQIWIPVPNNPAANKYLVPEKQSALVQQLLERLSALPGVEDAALGTPGDVPMLASVSNPRPFTLPDESTTQQDDHSAKFGSVSPSYFDALKIPLVKGRVFTAYDNISAPKVAVVNEAFVRKFSSRRDLVGRRLSGGRNNVVFEIVGIVADVRENGLDVETAPRVYFSLLQRPTVALSVFLRSHGELQSTKDALERVVHEVDPDLPTFGVRTMIEVMSASMARRRFSVSLMSAFALAAALLAALGIYGVMAFLVGQRGQEFGLRQALGATHTDILRLAFRPGFVLAAQGTLIGLIVAFPSTRLMSSLLFGVSARDPITFIAVPVFLAVVASVACLAPARRATRVDPIVALRG